MVKPDRSPSHNCLQVEIVRDEPAQRYMAPILTSDGKTLGQAQDEMLKAHPFGFPLTRVVRLNRDVEAGDAITADMITEEVSNYVSLEKALSGKLLEARSLLSTIQVLLNSAPLVTDGSPWNATAQALSADIDRFLENGRFV